MLAGYPPFYDENPFGIYQKILAGKIDFPRHFDVNAKVSLSLSLSPLIPDLNLVIGFDQKTLDCGPNQALWLSEERCRRHQDPQMVSRVSIKHVALLKGERFCSEVGASD